MMRRALMIINGILGVLLVLCLILWARSHFARDLLVVGDGYSWTLQAGTSPGMLHLNVTKPAIPSQMLAWRSDMTLANRPVMLSTQGDAREHTYRRMVLPFWGLAAGLAAIPLLTLLVTTFQQTKARRRLSRGQCPSCGHGLRGSAYHCPACGYRVPPETLGTHRLGQA